ncbi:redoxin family protein [Fusobacterium nucleatum subsp. nucleatum ATCC 23726]|uniref:Thiol:disulfide interchange protein n=2 Tax=Fusobacterium nucleatum subsp. nucleatum TaxID=76856 RepID=Q8RGU0_FUSNN|nr:redoxin family protein [Fusobacterium nucleatum]AAL94393.1 Thiol:disulfide interchange protein tlpA [Fusobacterium nucleatum subsp. nucleatum ATCC 25586]ASG26994.1 thiol:disulfide interchange protein [Fusobacterium nucleatum subsp. nucleatum]AVQ14689.1 thiol:disulfide interchange protein [Fusobacterium nucleatum subsp. nucleatum ATCC 25586]AVQ22885.1 thiol:disulfide interchange protein [Fusobacterium nucleatum subsp. nucleatum ATCC 23726]EFG95607.1 redoxin family protein [Fusobacterium nucl
MKGLKKLFLGIMMLLMGAVAFGAEMDLSKVTLKDLNGMSYSFGKDGKPTYVKFWASWCPICLSGLEDIDNLSKEKKDFEVVTVVSPGLVGEKKTEDFKKWYKSLEYKNIKVLLDEKGELSKMLNVRVYPTSVVVNKAGKAEKVLPGHLEKAEIKKLFSSKMNDAHMMKDDKMMMNDKGMKDTMMKDDKMMNDKHMMKDDKMNMEKKTSM